MDRNTKDVIKRIAEVQLLALNSIKSNFEDCDSDLVKSYLEIFNEDFNDQLDRLIDLYFQMKSIPTMIRCLSEYQLLICSHILYKFEEEWILNNPNGVRGTWLEIHKAMLKFHPEFTLCNV